MITPLTTLFEIGDVENDIASCTSKITSKNLSQELSLGIA